MQEVATIVSLDRVPEAVRFHRVPYLEVVSQAVELEVEAAWADTGSEESMDCLEHQAGEEAMVVEEVPLAIEKHACIVAQQGDQPMFDLEASCGQTKQACEDYHWETDFLRDSTGQMDRSEAEDLEELLPLLREM